MIRLFKRKSTASAAGPGAAAPAGAPDPGAAGAQTAAAQGAGPVPDAAHLLRRLEWTVIRRLDGLLQGDYRTLWRGVGLDLADLREYQLHDDVRHIDWNVTARVQSPHVRQFTEDRDLSAWFLVDLSPSADFGSRDVEKRDLAVQFVSVLARLLTRHGNKVGAMLYTTRVDQVIPARNSRLDLLRLMNAMLKRSRISLVGPTKLGDLLQTAVGTIKRRSSVFVLSDFISEPGWQRPLGLLAQRHDVVVVRLTDPLENRLPDLGLITLEDPETGEQLFVDTHDPAFRARFEALALQREQDLRAAFAKAGVDVLELSTDSPLFEAVVKFVDLRRRKLRMRAGVAATPTLQSAPPPKEAA